VSAGSGSRVGGRERAALPRRDRAEERRKGVNPDYERVTADLSGLATGTAALDEGGMTQISVEDSKFLGGDLEHTHLVKGLDYALLQKVGRCGALLCRLRSDAGA
jgi:hypothetical protein